jgi:hypothetical protein
MYGIEYYAFLSFPCRADGLGLETLYMRQGRLGGWNSGRSARVRMITIEKGKGNEMNRNEIGMNNNNSQMFCERKDTQGRSSFGSLKLIVKKVLL